MYTIDSLIDNVQNAKLTFINNFFPSEEMRKPLADFVESQREFTKTAVQTVADLNKAVYVEAAKAFKEITKP